ncbi:MAG: phenylacetate-CoA oxygenase subunit PaaJ [Phycisphaerales bacterium]|nr:phenylacetate-CoA oxygenase subunit PaaJ [Phycisphaerales bacterium]
MPSDADQMIEQRTSDTDRVWTALENVKDPEIPLISVVELGVIPEVRIEDGRVTVRMCPTFAGCPALDVMREDIRKAILAEGFGAVQVDVVFDPPWSTDRITPEGRRKLKEFGLAPPAKCNGSVTGDMLDQVVCPYCDSDRTTLESIFGPTLCRAIHYCNSCRQSFEQFKPV